MGISNKIIRIYEKFSSEEGSQHIASEYAILKLQVLIRKFDIKNVLEVGLGIGSIAGSLLEMNRGLTYSGIEKNRFCLESLPKNLGSNYKRLTIYPNLLSVPTEIEFGLVIIDGKDPDLPAIKKMLSMRGIIVLEGDRLQQQKVLQNFDSRQKMVHAISLRKNKSYSPFPAEEWQGGLKIIFTNPSRTQYIWWLKEKILTKLKYQYPGRHFGPRGELTNGEKNKNI